MADLGTTITKTQKDSEPEQRHRMASRAGDLLSSAQLNKSESKRQSQADFGECMSCSQSPLISTYFTKL